MSQTNDHLEQRADSFEARIEELELRARREVSGVEQRAASFLSGVRLNPRLITAFAVLAAVVLLLAAVLPDAAALGAWLATHAQWTIQIAFVATAAILVNAAFLLLQVTVLDPLLIGPEVKQAWLGWFKAHRDGERGEHDALFLLAGAIYSGCTLLMMGLITLGVFLAGSAM